MEKTVNINLSGLLFRVEDKAFNKLREYLQSINSKFRNIDGGAETIDDIESRIAEIFLSKVGKDGVVTLSVVDEMIIVMGNPEDYSESEELPGTSSPTSRRLYRDPDESIIAGVAGGLGAYLRMDPVWVRLLFIITTLIGGAGFFLYLVLWAVLPVADTEIRKRELYGDDYIVMVRRKARGKNGSSMTPVDNLANGLNTVFSAIGRVILIFLRVILGFIGLVFLIAGFSAIVATFIILFFNHVPLFAGALDPLFFDLRAFLGIIVAPTSVTFLLFLISVVTIMPMLAIVYWGIRMIFQFNVRDRIFNLVMFLVWLLALITLIFFAVAQGLNFNDRARSVETIALPGVTDTLYISPGNTTASLEWDKVFEIPDSEGPSLYWNADKKQVYGTPRISIRRADDETSSVEVRKYSSSVTPTDSHFRAESIKYDVVVSDKVIKADGFFSLPPDTRYRGDYVKVLFYIAEGTVVWIDEDLERYLDRDRYGNNYYWQMGGKFWIMTDEGLEPIK